MGIGIIAVPDEYVILRFYVILLCCFSIPYLWLTLRGEAEIEWPRDIPFIIVHIGLLPLAFVGSFAMIGGVIFLVLGLLDRVVFAWGLLLLFGGATPVAAMKGVSMLWQRRGRKEPTIYPWTERIKRR